MNAVGSGVGDGEGEAEAEGVADGVALRLLGRTRSVGDAVGLLRDLDLQGLLGRLGLLPRREAVELLPAALTKQNPSLSDAGAGTSRAWAMASRRPVARP